MRIPSSHLSHYAVLVVIVATIVLAGCQTNATGQPASVMPTRAADTGPAVSSPIGTLDRLQLVADTPTPPRTSTPAPTRTLTPTPTVTRTPMPPTGTLTTTPTRRVVARTAQPQPQATPTADCGPSNGRPTNGKLDVLWSIIAWREVPGDRSRVIGTIEVLPSGGGGCYQYNFMGRDYAREPIEFEVPKCSSTPVELIVTALDGQKWKYAWILAADDPNWRCK